MMDISKLKRIRVDGVDPSDHPDYVDSYVCYAELDGKALTEDQLDELNELFPWVAQENAFDELLD